MNNDLYELEVVLNFSITINLLDLGVKYYKC
jgi:hypothetical protein